MERTPMIVGGKRVCCVECFCLMSEGMQLQCPLLQPCLLSSSGRGVHAEIDINKATKRTGGQAVKHGFILVVQDTPKVKRHL